MVRWLFVESGGPLQLKDLLQRLQCSIHLDSPTKICVGGLYIDRNIFISPSLVSSILKVYLQPWFGSRSFALLVEIGREQHAERARENYDMDQNWEYIEVENLLHAQFYRQFATIPYFDPIWVVFSSVTRKTHVFSIKKRPIPVSLPQVHRKSVFRHQV